jgi:predicted XRE-type DNA-binding protein
MVTFKSKMTYQANRPESCVRGKEEIELGSGNVFADLGLRNAEARQLKAELAIIIAQSVATKHWNSHQVTQRTGLDQSELSLLLRGRLSGFSTDRLSAIINRLELGT